MSNTLSKTEMLFIRACKSRNPQKRLKSVYRRFYLADVEHSDVYILGILAEIVDQYIPMTLTEALSRMNPEDIYTWKAENDNYTSRCLASVTSYIRLTGASKFPGLARPLKMKKLAEEVA